MHPKSDFPPPIDSESAKPPMVYISKEQTWKYKHISYDLQDGSAPAEEMLDELGSAGWELAGMFVQGQALHLYFKRLG
ncbi:MAG TPA: hypothetical protein VLA49_05855 [Anaerolineales bacterium]|nr:hypothetical protein [Anaerolineales bacterium]